MKKRTIPPCFSLLCTIFAHKQAVPGAAMARALYL